MDSHQRLIHESNYPELCSNVSKLITIANSSPPAIGFINPMVFEKKYTWQSVRRYGEGSSQTICNMGVMSQQHTIFLLA